MTAPIDEIEVLVGRNPGQMKVAEYVKVYEEIEKVAPARIAVFGAGMDTYLWCRANAHGEINLIESSAYWLQKAFLEAEARETAHLCRVIPRAVRYSTLLTDAGKYVAPAAWDKLVMEDLADMAGDLALALVDGPHGEGAGAPGRMQSIYMAGKRTKKGGVVMVHDCHRRVEREFGGLFLGGKPAEMVHHLGVWRL